MADTVTGRGRHRLWRRLNRAVWAAGIAVIVALAGLAAPAYAAGSLQITGTVTDQNGVGVSNVSVTATQPGTVVVVFGPVTTDTGGHYEIDVDPGTYDFHFVPDPATGLNEVIRTGVAVSASQVISVQLTPIPVPPVVRTLSGTVRDAGGSPVPHVLVELSSGTSGFTDSAGHYVVSEPPGVYSFFVQGGSGGTGPIQVPGLPGFFTFGQGPNPPQVDLSAGDVVEDMRLPATAVVTVTVKDAAGNPVSGATASANGVFAAGAGLVMGGSQMVGGSSYNTASTDATGTARILVFRGLSFTPATICATATASTPFTVCTTTTMSTTNGDLAVIFQQQPSAPPAPTGLAVTTPARTPVLTWQPVSSASSYTIYRDGTAIAATVALTFTDTTAAEGQHTYAVASTDTSGHTGSPSTPVNALVDTTKPTIDANAAPAANGNGWNNTPVTVTFTCSDALSGIAVCPAPLTLTTDGATQAVTGTAVDRAGNTASTTVTISIDQTRPSITATPTPATSSGWNNTDVTVIYTCTDAPSGIATCPNPVTLTGEGTNQTASGSTSDRADNTATVTVSGINIDKTPPMLGTPAWTTNPKPTGSPTAPVTVTLTVPATDALSGVAAGEYFIGPDPETGQGTSMSYTNGTLTAALGAGLPAGVYDIGVRGRDTAGNWSAAVATMLVVYDPSGAGVTGKNNKDLIPSLTNGDRLPGLTQDSQTDPVDYGFTVDYRNGSLDPHNDFHLNYTTGTHCNTANPVNCHQLILDATSFEWLIIDSTNNSHGRFQGTATVTVDGVTTTNPFVVDATDGDRLTPTTDDHITITIYAPGADPATTSPLYKASGSITKGNAVRIR